MGKKMLRSVLVAAFSVVALSGVLSGLSDAKGDVRANTGWPTTVEAINTGWPAVVATDADDSTTDGLVSTDGAGS
ncbi:hypothetical protein ACFWPQ_09610 [Streptomyces sp. NPDC058464]|uniref:hypothetical protein n=1 Tax=Streptomyces sp. NPDC058464 TaxID=3346511 RepID=UPI00365A0C2D